MFIYSGPVSVLTECPTFSLLLSSLIFLVNQIWLNLLKDVFVLGQIIIQDTLNMETIGIVIQGSLDESGRGVISLTFDLGHCV